MATGTDETANTQRMEIMTHLNHFAAVLISGEFSYGKLCEDCMFQHANGDVENDSRTAAELEIAEKNCAAYEFTLGHLHDGEWSARCWHSNSNCEEDCDCERDDFNSDPCSMCGTGLAGYRNDCIIIDRKLLEHKMTQEQFDKLADLCRRYKVPMKLSDYVVRQAGSIFTPLWIESWVGGNEQENKTLFVGVAPDGASHS